MKNYIIVFVVMLLASSKGFPQTSSYSSGQAENLYKELAQAYSLQGKEMSKEEEEKILKTFSSELRSKFEEIKKLDKNKYYHLLRTKFPFGVGNFGPNKEEVEVYGLAWASDNEKKETNIEIDVELLALKLKNSESELKHKIKSELSEKLGNLFEVKEAKKQKEVERLEKRLQELKESLRYRKQNKNEIVQRRMQELLGDSKYLRWE